MNLQQRRKIICEFLQARLIRLYFLFSIFKMEFDTVFKMPD